MIDLAGVLASRELEPSLARAEREGLLRLDDLSQRIARIRPRRGIATLRALLGTPTGPALTRSEAEERFLAMVRRARLPHPETNASLGLHEVDFLWRREQVVVDVDGFAYHATRKTFERDRARDAELSAAGIQVIRTTWRQLTEAPGVLLVRLAQTLALRSPAVPNEGHLVARTRTR